MTLITRSEWQARIPKEGNEISPSPKGVAIHWEGPPLGALTHTQCFSKVRAIQAFHMDDRGWSDIAYNFLPCPHGFVFEGRGLRVGSAANGDRQANYDYYAICALCGQGDPQPPELYQAIRDAVALCRTRCGNTILGHRDLFQTACPGDLLYGHVQKGTFIPREDDMTAAENWGYPLGYNPADGKTPVNAGYSLEIARNYSFHSYKEALAARERDAALAAKVAALACVTEDRLRQIVREELAAVLPANLADQVVSALAKRLEG